MDFQVQSDTFVDVAQEQYFDHSVPFALLAGVVLAAPLVVRWRWEVRNRQLSIIAGVDRTPTAVLLLYSVAGQPIYYPRYLCYTSRDGPAARGLHRGAGRTRERVTAVLPLSH